MEVRNVGPLSLERFVRFLSSSACQRANENFHAQCTWRSLPPCPEPVREPAVPQHRTSLLLVRAFTRVIAPEHFNDALLHHGTPGLRVDCQALTGYQKADGGRMLPVYVYHELPTEHLPKLCDKLLFSVYLLMEMKKP